MRKIATKIFNSFVALLILLFGLAFVLVEHSDNNNRKEIIEKLDSMDAEVLSIEQKGVFEADPFKFSEKNTKMPEIYYFEYVEDNEVHSGWVSFDYFDVHWKFDNE